ncbi:hypothetical protein WMF28_24110 [Sorangium sp. So ce590]|uniref:hypothetical protein n=1 Tax=Sorangium sp. So ce590 TaxID=3133317 RepID=UPI003F6248E8
MKLEDVTNGASLEGVEPSSVVTLVATILISPDSLQLIYRLPDGALRERLVSRADEAVLALATSARPWSFDGDGAAFQLTAEAKRIDLAFLFDPMMAVHTSNIVAPAASSSSGATSSSRSSARTRGTCCS